MERPRNIALERLLQDDTRAAELYALLPEEVQSMVQQSTAQSLTAEDLEAMTPLADFFVTDSD